MRGALAYQWLDMSPAVLVPLVILSCSQNISHHASCRPGVLRLTLPGPVRQRGLGRIQLTQFAWGEMLPFPRYAHGYTDAGLDLDNGLGG